MIDISTKEFLKNVIDKAPQDWIKLTTHRLDIYNEELAKTEFLDYFSKLKGKELNNELDKLPTAFDYIRLGHPLSCILEWTIAQIKEISVDKVITFSSQMMPLLAILRKNSLIGKNTNIYYIGELPSSFNEQLLKDVYEYSFELIKVGDVTEVKKEPASTVLITDHDHSLSVNMNGNFDFMIGMHPHFGSITYVGCEDTEGYVSEIQHVRRRESIAMTPIDCYSILREFVGLDNDEVINTKNKDEVIRLIQNIANSNSAVSLGSCGLSIQYAILMGLIDYAKKTYPEKSVKIIVPPNCYGGTNDQARRVAACLNNVDIMDLPVDGGRDMVQSIDKVLEECAHLDAIPLIIAEIPTNPRVEVPDLEKLNQALTKKRLTPKDVDAVGPIFILDQTFCPNVKFLGENDILSNVNTISYVSGSKFPSGGLVTAGYCIANKKASELMTFVEKHLVLHDNTANAFQIEILSEQLPSMLDRILNAYKNTRAFVDFIEASLPEAKINFVSNELAGEGFTPSVFSLDLPTKGESEEEKESFKREMNLKLIKMMITKIPQESKHCVSYGQLKGCYWTIPATSTQGTTKEGDKDYIVRVSVSPLFDLEAHKAVFNEFVESYL